MAISSFGPTVFSTLKNNSDLGAFTPLEEDQMFQIFFRVQEIIRNSSLPLVCKTFHYVLQNPQIACLALENKLKEETTLTYANLKSYCIPFRQRYGIDLPLSRIFASCPGLTTLDLSNSLINNAFLGKVLEVAKDCAHLNTLNLNDCHELTQLVNLNGLKFLQKLYLSNCTNLTGELNLDGLESLQFLTLMNCMEVTELLNLNALTQLKFLSLIRCTGLTSLHLDGLTQLETLKLSVCHSLTGKLDLKDAKLINSIEMPHCRRVTGLLNLNGLKFLKLLNIKYCKGLVDIDLSGLPATAEIIR